MIMFFRSPNITLFNETLLPVLSSVNGNIKTMSETLLILQFTKVPTVMPTISIYYKLDINYDVYKATMTLDQITSVGTYSYYRLGFLDTYVNFFPTSFQQFVTRTKLNVNKQLNIMSITQNGSNIGLNNGTNYSTYNNEIESIVLEDPENCVVPIEFCWFSDIVPRHLFYTTFSPYNQTIEVLP